MSVGNIGRPLSQLAIPRSQLPNLVEAFKPLNSRLAMSAGTGGRSVMPVPIPRPGAATVPVPIPRPSLPLPFSKPVRAEVQHLQSVVSAASRSVGSLESQIQKTVLQSSQLNSRMSPAQAKVGAVRNMFDSVSRIARQQSELQGKILRAGTAVLSSISSRLERIKQLQEEIKFEEGQIKLAEESLRQLQERNSELAKKSDALQEQISRTSDPEKRRELLKQLDQIVDQRRINQLLQMNYSNNNRERKAKIAEYQAEIAKLGERLSG